MGLLTRALMKHSVRDRSIGRCWIIKFVWLPRDVSKGCHWSMVWFELGCSKFCWGILLAQRTRLCTKKLFCMNEKHVRMHAKACTLYINCTLECSVVSIRDIFLQNLMVNAAMRSDAAFNWTPRHHERTFILHMYVILQNYQKERSMCLHTLVAYFVPSLIDWISHFPISSFRGRVGKKSEKNIKNNGGKLIGEEKFVGWKVSVDVR